MASGDPHGTELGALNAIAASVSSESTSLSVLDDWDESDRAKVNPIVGQAGVAANAGTSSASTIRTVEATDSLLNTTATNIETFTNTIWIGNGKKSTSITDDGDLRTVDTDAEAIALDPTANTTGAANVGYTRNFMLRWIIKLIQGWRTQAIPAGEAHLGSIGGNTFSLAVTQTTNASAYEAGDAVGGKITITNAMRVSGGTGVLQSIDLIDKGNQKAAMELLIFNADPTAATITDDAAFVYSTDISKQIARIPIVAADYVTLNSIATVSLGGLGRIVKASGSANLFAAIVTTGTPTYISTTDIIITFGILQD